MILIITCPDGNFFKNASVLLVTPNSKFDATVTLTPENSAAISALYARKFSGYVYKVYKKKKKKFSKYNEII